MILMDFYQQRVLKAQEKMKQEAFDYLLIGPFASMFYFSGFQAFPDERLQLLIIPATGQPTAVLPEMYEKMAGAVFGDSFELSVWPDQVDPFRMTFDKIKGSGPKSIAVDDLLRTDHLLGLMGVLPESSFKPASLLTDALRKYKDEHELNLMSEAGKIADRVLEKVVAEIRPGLSEKELAFFVEAEYKKLADDGSFKPIIASGPNSAKPHYTPGDRKLEKGDYIIVDCGALYKGYCSDITRTFCLGKASDEMKKVYRTVQQANAKAFEALSENSQLSGEGADLAARTVIDNAGYGEYFTHRTGHGIGLEVHEAPYLVEGNKEPLEKGMTFTIEPGIYLSGQFGVRIEDTVAITDQGARNLTGFSRELLEI